MFIIRKLIGSVFLLIGVVIILIGRVIASNAISHATSGFIQRHAFELLLLAAALLLYAATLAGVFPV